ncbi:MAG: FAD-dependent oxidoreductase [Weeksellaceae bacterium]|nr:FAD-dependent oxidoreductase [Weeksellaceae bacterium]
MKRDGINNSIWVNSVYLHQNPDGDHGIYDAIIVGGGITGLTLALELQIRGQQCLVLEQRNIGFGTTGGTTAHINNFFDESYDRIISKFGEDKAQTIADYAMRVASIIKKNTADYNIDCDFEECSFYLLSVEKKQDKILENILKAHRDLDVPSRSVLKIPFETEFRTAIEIDGQAQFHPLKYIAGLAKAFAEKGGSLLTNTQVSKHETKDNIIEVSTGQGRSFSGRNLIWATHIPPGVNRFSMLNAPYRSYALAAKLNNEPENFAQAADLYDPYHYFRYHKMGGESYLIVGGFDHKTGHEKDTGKPFEDLVQYAKENFNIGEVTSKWSSQYYVPTDGLPYIGRMPGEEQVYLATGYNGNGMTWGTLAAQIISDLILKKDNELADILSPSRVEIAASAQEFVKENLDAAFHLIKDQFSSDKKGELDGLETGEGKVLEYNGQKVAAYRDDMGNLKLLTADCPHMGCTVQFNSAERTWDCPCHGSRFDTEGNVINVPAQEGLKSI